MNVGNAEEAVAAPWIVGKAIPDLLCMGGADDEQDFGCAFERAAEEHEAIVDEGIHESGVRLPVVLLFEVARFIPARASGACDDEELRHLLSFGECDGRGGMAGNRAGEPVGTF
jgi:hypothetical protein